jgi:ADP-heptose:LPS heptosyltransferase
MIRAKWLFYRSSVRRHAKTHSSLQIGPKVLVAMDAGGIGNAVEATPFVQAIRMLWPRAVITILTPPGDLFDDWAIPDHITTSVKDLEGTSYDYTFFPYWIWKGMPEWTKSIEPGRVFHTNVWLNQCFLKSEAEYNLDMLKQFGYKGMTPAPYVSLMKPQIDIQPADLRICIVPGAKKQNLWKHKRWPYYDELIKMLLARYPAAQICIIGIKDDEIAGELPSDPRLVDLRGALTLRQSAWVLKHAHAAIGNDCGPMHIAGAAQTPSVVIFGPTCELKNSPQNKVICLSLDISCRPCQFGSLVEKCRKPCCMTKITPDMVITKLKELLVG